MDVGADPLCSPTHKTTCVSPKQAKPWTLTNSHSHVYDTIITVAVGPDDAKKKF